MGPETSYRSISPDAEREKHDAVRSMFDSIATGYDRVNRAMTLGLDVWWRRQAAREARLEAGGVCLDVGTGTGDLALALGKSAPGVSVIAVDYSPAMLVRAPAKALSSGLGGRIGWVAADGLELPFDSGTFDAVASGFVLRNFASLPDALSEMRRVLKPGGRFVALEASPSGSKLVGAALRFHYMVLVPAIGTLLTGNRTAYRYLGQSVAAFATPSEMTELMTAADLVPRPPVLLAGGAVVIHRATRAT